MPLPEEQKTTVYIINGIIAAYKTAVNNSLSLGEIAKANPQLAASVSVLCLEEIGKMILLDGLIFSKIGDERYSKAEKGYSKHKSKLDAAEFIPIYISYLMELNPELKKDKIFQKVLLIMLLKDKENKNNLRKVFGSDFWLSDLDKIKQKGFYSDKVNTEEFKSADELLTEEQSRAVVELALSSIDLLRFVFNRTQHQYENSVQDIRTKIDDNQIKGIRDQAKKIVESVFPDSV